MLVKHLRDALVTLDPDVRILTAEGVAPCVRLETHWYVEWTTLSSGASARHWEFHAEGGAARALAKRLRLLGCSCIKVEPVTTLVFA